nr:phosphoenolpyruvate carboxykinase domain-containing protein [Clostridiales bacterium]
KELLSVDKEAWLEDCVSIRDFFAQIGDHVPQEMYDELDKLEENLKK